MSDDRQMICDIISDMLDHPDDNGIYPTGLAYDRLEAKIGLIRRMEIARAVGWAYADCCSDLDAGKNPRKTEMPDVLERAFKDLE